MNHAAPPRFLLAVVLTAAVLAVSSAAILIRLAQAPALVIAAARLVMTTAILLPFYLGRHGRATGSDRHRRGTTLLAGLLLGLHFATWVAALQHTNVASATVLAGTGTLFVGLFSGLVNREPVGRRLAAGLVVAFVGAALVALSDRGAGDRALTGDLLAVLSALAYAGYMLMGRRVRAGGSLLGYLVPLYGTAAAVLSLAVLISGLPVFPWSGQTLAAIIGLALLPTLVGHSGFNWALRHVSPARLGLLVPLEPIIASLIAIPVLGEVPGPALIIGGGVTLVGILVGRGGDEEPATAPRRAEPG